MNHKRIMQFQIIREVQNDAAIRKIIKILPKEGEVLTIATGMTVKLKLFMARHAWVCVRHRSKTRHCPPEFCSSLFLCKSSVYDSCHVAPENFQINNLFLLERLSQILGQVKHGKYYQLVQVQLPQNHLQQDCVSVCKSVNIPLIYSCKELAHFVENNLSPMY